MQRRVYRTGPPYFFLGGALTKGSAGVRDGPWTPGGYYISKGLWIEMRPVSPEFQLEHCKVCLKC